MQATQATYTSAEVCKMLQVSPAQLKYMVDAGKLSRVVPPHHTKKGFYLKDEVDAMALEMAAFNQKFDTPRP